MRVETERSNVHTAAAFFALGTEMIFVRAFTFIAARQRQPELSRNSSALFSRAFALLRSPHGDLSRMLIMSKDVSSVSNQTSNGQFYLINNQFRYRLGWKNLITLHRMKEHALILIDSTLSINILHTPDI